MVEGQNGLTWPRWKRLAAAAEDLGFAGLYRSDHFTLPWPPDKDSLELWVSLTWLADHSRRIAFGPLCTPMSFRHPVFTARMAAAVDDLSGGRMVLGVGAGWQEREHAMFGFALLGMRERFARFQEALEVMTRLLSSEKPVSFEGRYYRLRDAVLLPRPARLGGPPILVGGRGPTRTLPLAARYATEWNASHQTPEAFARLNGRLDELLGRYGRQRGEMRRSVMTGIVFGRTQAEVEAKLRARGVEREALRARGILVGTAAEIRDQLEALAMAGVQGVMLQWLDLDDIEGLEALAKILDLI